MLPVIVACVLAACLIPHASVAQDTVPAEDLCQLQPYNIKNLTSKPYWFTNVNVSKICSDPNATSCTLYFSFCKALKLPFSTTHCDGSAVCLVSRDAKGNELHNFSLGQFSSNETQFYETNGTESGGFYTEVKSGSTVPQCNNTGFSTRIDLVCDPSVQWQTQNLTNSNISNVELDDMCSYKITLLYAGACLPHNPISMSISTPSLTPTPSSSTTTSVGPTSSSSAAHNSTSSSSKTTSVGPTSSSSSTHNPTSSSSTTTSVSPTNTSSATVNPTTSSSMTSSSSSSGSTSVTPPNTMTTSTSSTSQSTQSQTGSMTAPALPTATPTGTPTSSPTPSHQTTTKKHPKTPTTHPQSSTAEPTANPLASKVSGLTAGIVIFALLFFVSLLVVIGLVWYFKFHKGRYHKLPNEDL